MDAGCFGSSGYVRGVYLTLHCTRWGAARELVKKGGTVADLCVAGSWGTQQAMKKYLDLQQVESAVASRTL